MSSAQTIFERILKGEIPCKRVFEDEHTFAFNDIAPQAPVHVLIIPKIKIVNVGAAESPHADQLGRILLTAGHVARILGVDESGYRLVFNNGRDGGQSVDYLHCHLLAGRPLNWPPG
ncbi:histidine triad nucleotide-binding protein [bacterium]|nr:histidine triad nucleotide-binding protein [bacterium]